MSNTDYTKHGNTIRLIKKLGAKAASTAFLEEAETARRMAAELRSKLAVWPDFPPPKPGPKPFVRYDRTPEARRRSQRGVISAVGKTKNIKPVTVAATEASNAENWRPTTTVRSANSARTSYDYSNHNALPQKATRDSLQQQPHNAKSVKPSTTFSTGVQNMTSSTTSAHMGNPSWTVGRSGNNMGRPLTPKGVRSRLMQELSARVLDGDKSALEAFIRLEKAGAGE